VKFVLRNDEVVRIAAIFAVIKWYAVTFYWDFQALIGFRQACFPRLPSALSRMSAPGTSRHQLL